MSWILSLDCNHEPSHVWEFEQDPRDTEHWDTRLRLMMQEHDALCSCLMEKETRVLACIVERQRPT